MRRAESVNTEIRLCRCQQCVDTGTKCGAVRCMQCSVSPAVQADRRLTLETPAGVRRARGGGEIRRAGKPELHRTASHTTAVRDRYARGGIDGVQKRHHSATLQMPQGITLCPSNRLPWTPRNAGKRRLVYKVSRQHSAPNAVQGNCGVTVLAGEMYGVKFDQGMRCNAHQRCEQGGAV